MRSRALVLALAFSVLASGAARAEGCNVSDVLFGKVRIELIYNKEFQYETGIVFGNDFDSKRFSRERMLGRISSSERNGERSIRNTNGDICATIDERLNIEVDPADCNGCSFGRMKLQKVGNSLAVMGDRGSIMGTIEGRLPK